MLEGVPSTAFSDMIWFVAAVTLVLLQQTATRMIETLRSREDCTWLDGADAE